jgi:hypothetical protein
VKFRPIVPKRTAGVVEIPVGNTVENVGICHLVGIYVRE